MTVIFKPITQADLDHFFDLKEADKFAPYLFMHAGTDSRFIEQGVQIAIDDTKSNYIVRLPQGDRLDLFSRYVLVSDGKIIVSKAMPLVHAFYIEYVNPALVTRLAELTPFLRETFSNGGKYLFDDFPNDVDLEVGAQMNFVFSNKLGE